MIPFGYQADGTTSPTRSVLAQSQCAVQLAQAASRGVGWVCGACWGDAHETENKVHLVLLRIIRLKENAPETRLQLVLRENSWLSFWRFVTLSSSDLCTVCLQTKKALSISTLEM
jgi:hypothetical protein